MAENSPPATPRRTASPKPLSKDDYMVGWIVALAHELAVARALLDEEHDTPNDFEQNPHDTNNYKWGRIGKHNVVIASLPAGSYGITEAARTATQLITSWPHLRFGLMVGIGAGIPKVVDGRVLEGYDIRLGVVQHDLGKFKDGRFERVGTLNKPPEALLKCIQTVQADYEMVGSKIPIILGAMYAKYPKMKEMCAYQGADEDLLFDASNTGEKRVERPQRNSTDPEVHYGLIASGNLVVKDAGKRADIVGCLEDECICLEMEAAGLMDTFPCLVIRGICDYADAHKNDRWQRYAAATAGAFAKELLESLNGKEVKKTKTLEELFCHISKDLSRIDKIISDIATDDHFERLRKWLQAPDTSTNYRTAFDKRHGESGTWLLQSEKLRKWKSGSLICLWLHGFPGSGKTILSSVLIRHLREDNASSRPCLYFFFDFGNPRKQGLEDLIRSLFQQLLNYQVKAALNSLTDLHKEYFDGREQPLRHTLIESFRKLPYRLIPIDIVVDALDECIEQLDVLNYLHQLTTEHPRHIRVVLTSRSEESIRSILSAWISTEAWIVVGRVETQQDLRKFVRASLNEHDFLRRRRKHPQDIEDAIVKKANGMFRLAALQLNELKGCVTDGAIKAILQNLPNSLYDMYDRMLSRILTPHKRQTVQLLQFLLFSHRHLSPEEAIDAMCINLERDPLFRLEDRIQHENDILNLCPGLFEIRKDNYARKIHFSHASVKDYLVSLPHGHELERPLSEIFAQDTLSKVYLFYTSAIAKSKDSSEGILGAKEFKPHLVKWHPATRSEAASTEALCRYVEQQRNWRNGKDDKKVAYEMAFQESVLSNLWGKLYEKTSEEYFLREAVRLGLVAVRSLKDTDRYDRPNILDGASTWLLLQFLNEGNTRDLIECIKMRKMALDPPPDDYKARGRLEYQKNQALRFMYDHTNDEKYLLEALDAQQKLVDDQIELHNYLNLDELNLLIGLYCSNFNRAKELSHLQNALRWGDIAVRAAQSGTSVECWYVRATHSMTLYFHYRHAREYKSLESALELSKRVLLESKVRNKKERATDFANNAVMLIAKYERDKQKDPQNPLACLGLVDEAIESIEDGIRTLQSTGEARRSEELVILAGLHDKAGSYFGEKFRATGNPLFGRKAIEHAEQSVEIIPKYHPHRPFHLSNLAANLVSMYHFESQPSEKKLFNIPDKAHTVAREAVFENQASMFENENLATLDKALTTSHEAVEATADDDPELAQQLNNLGIIEILQGLNIHSKGKHFPKARDHFLKAARHEFAHPLVRISAGLRAGRIFLQGREPKMADEVLQEVMSLIPSISPRSNSAEDLQDVLTGVTGLSNLAAAAALEAGSSSEAAAWKALQTLESGRCMIAGLRMSAGTANPADDSSQLSGGRDEIMRLASQGPIITFNVERARSDAIIVTSKGIKILSLPDLKYEKLEEGLQVILNGGTHSARKVTTASEDSLTKSPFALFQELGVSDRMVAEAVTLDTQDTRAYSSEERHIRVKVEKEDRTVDGFLKWIWQAAVKPVLDSIDDAEMQPSRRVWWVNSGLMGLAPIHAAGFHAKGSRDNTMSRIVSSYVSSFKALKFARERKAVNSPELKMLEITMPTSPSGHGSLNVTFEERAIQDVFKENITKLMHPTPKQVLEHLPTHPFAHFACHGLSVPGDPSQSGLLLVEDGNAAILTVGDLEQVNLEQAQIAYLSACSTAELSNVMLMDEAIHLANAFQIAGFQNVVGTVWAANDEAAGQIARRFYASLFELGPDEDGEQQVAKAVHKAIFEYRDSEEIRRDIWKWAPFIHIGV